MKNFYDDFRLQREDILARIAQKLELDPTRREKMEQSYSAVSDWLDKDEGFFKGKNIDIYAHGSVRTYTTVKPLNDDDFDLDIVLHLNHLYSGYTPQQIYNELIRRLKENENYSRMLEHKNRCARLNYAGNFHMDILPGCLITIVDVNKLNVPDKKLSNWTPTNPKDYSEWFLKIANSVISPILEGYFKKAFSEGIMLKAETEDLPNESFFTKKPLQRAVQLIKRRRDIYFADIPEYRTSSIILTTLAAQLYSGEDTIYGTIDSILNKITLSFNEQRRLKILNPIMQEEDFSEKWEKEPKLYEYFKKFVKDFHTHWQTLKQDLSKSSDTYDLLFGAKESIYKDVLIKQTRLFSKISDDKLIKTSGILLGGNSLTDTYGNINSERGIQNERHRDFGDL